MFSKYRLASLIVLITTLLITTGSRPIVSAQGIGAPPSVFYQFDIVAKTGDKVVHEILDNKKDNQMLRKIDPGVSINDLGEVVFVANEGKKIVRRQLSGELEGITPILPFSENKFAPVVTTNNQSLALAHNEKKTQEADVFELTTHLWRIDPILNRVVDQETHNFTKEMIGSGEKVVYPDIWGKVKISSYDKTYSCTSINTSGQITFLAYRYPNDFLVTLEEHKKLGTNPAAYELWFHETMINVIDARITCPSITDDGRVLLWTKTEPNISQTIQIFNFERTESEMVATTLGPNPWWSKLGINPGISRSGKVAIFYGDLTAAGSTALQTIPGPGIFASIDEGIKDTRKVVRVAGWPIGYAENIEAPGGNDDGFCDSGEECLEDVKAAQAAGTWDGTPKCDPGEICAKFAELGFDTTGKPLGSFSSSDSFIQSNRIAVLHQISDKTGISGDSFTLAFIATPRQELGASPKALWTVRVDIKQIEDKGQPEQARLIYQPMRPQRVVQVGDELGGYTIQDIAIHEPLASTGRGSHQLAFWAKTDRGEMVVRATPYKRIVVTTGSATVDGDTSNVDALLANPGADGKISLSEALSAVNQSGAGYTINFSLPPGEKAVYVENDLQLTASNTTIDGDINTDGEPDIEIHGQYYGRTSFVVSSDSNFISGISLLGIIFEGLNAYDNTLFNSYIGNIGGFAGDGIVIRNRAHHNRILGNRVQSNISYGITIQDGAHDNLIGEAKQPSLQTICDIPCNVIKNNPNGGVTVLGDNTYGNSIRGNLIFDNGDYSLVGPPKTLGIDLGGDGITLNDVPARMQGPNTLLNAPMSLAADFDGTNTVISGVYKAKPIESTAVIIDIYGKDKPGDFGEATVYLGFTTPQSNGSFELLIPDKLLIPYISATATDDKGNTSEFSLQTPIIFVPGVSGSVLVEDGEEIWVGLNTQFDFLLDFRKLVVELSNPLLIGLLPDRIAYALLRMDRFRQRLNLDNPVKGTVVASDAIRYVPSDEFLRRRVVAYGDFLNALSDRGGYREYQVNNEPLRRTLQGCDYASQSIHAPTLFVFAYDWRLSNKDNAKELRQYMLCVQKFHPGAKVNLVGHSMGGILARRYILDNPNHHVGRMISIATPWIGAGKVAYALATGDFIPVIASGESIKDAMWSMPSAIELFLSPTWLDPAILKQKTPIYGAIEKNGIYYAYKDDFGYADFMNQLPIIARCRQSALNKCKFDQSLAQGFHSPDQEFMKPDETGVKYFHLYSTQVESETIERVRAELTPPRCKNMFRSDCSKPGIRFVKEKGLGDETVPLLSLSPWNKDRYRTENDRKGSYETNDHRIVCEFKSPSASDDKYYSHAYVPNNELVRNKVLELLVGSSPLPEVCIPHSDRQLGQRQPQFINMFWPLPTPTVVQAGAEGQYASSMLEVNGAWGQIISDSAGNSTAIISNTMLLDDITDISLQSSGEQFAQWTLVPTETYTVTLLTTDEPFSIALATNDGVTVTQAVRYQDIVVPQGIPATLMITPYKIPTLSYDGNGDGLLETVITPTLVISGPLAADIKPPEITIRVTDVQTPFLTINLSAQDSGSGVKALWYSLDGTHYQLYREPFQAHADQTLYAFADDNVANRASNVQTLDITPPNVHIDAPAFPTTVNQGEPITVTVTATDNVFVRAVNVTFNALGEGIDTTVSATLVSTDTFQALLSPITGRVGLRTIRVDAFDPSNNRGMAETTVEVRSDELTPTTTLTVTITDTPTPTPSATPIPSPTHLRIEVLSDGMILSLGSALQVSLATNTNADIHWVIVTFDIDGNGTLDGPGEAQIADLDDAGRYTVQFAGISGSLGARYIHAFVVNGAGAIETAFRKVTVAEISDEPTFTPTPTPIACPTGSVEIPGGCATITPTPTATATATSTNTPTPTSTATPSPTPSATSTSTSTSTPTSTATDTVTATATATIKPTRTPTSTPTLTPTATGSEVRWKANGSGAWEDSGNWDTGTVPGPSSVVIIDNPDVTVLFSQGPGIISSLNCAGNFIISGSTLDIAKASVISKTFVLSGGTLTGSGDLTVNGELTWSAGYMSGSGRTIASSKLQINGSPEKRLSGRTLENLHEATWSAPAHTGFLILEAGAIFKNRPGAVFDVQFDGYLAGNATFANEGTFIKSAGADAAEVTVAFNNSGKVEIQAGTLALKGGGVSQGEFIAAPEAMLSFGAHTFERGAQIKAAHVRFESDDAVEFKAGSTYNVTDSTDFASGAINFGPGSTVENVGNSVTITAASVNFSSSSVITTQNLVMMNGELKGIDDIIIADYLAWHGGQMSGPGQTIIEGEADLTGGNMMLNGRMFDNRGTVHWNSPHGAVLLVMRGGAVLNNTGYFFVEHNSPGIGLLHVYDSMETVNNNGKFFLHDSSGVVEIRATFNNRGEVSVESGTLRLAGGGVASGQFLGAEGATLAFGSNYTLAQPSIINATNVDFDGGGTIDIYGAYAVTGSTSLSGIASPVVNFKPDTRITNLGDSLSIGGNCTLDLNSTHSIILNELMLVRGTLTGTDDITVNGKLIWDDGVISGSGKLTANGGIEIKGNGGKGLRGRTLDNKGVATWDGLVGANSLHISTGGIFNNLPNAVFDVKFDGNIYAGDGTFNNLGLFRKSGATRVMQIMATFNNRGEVNVESGTLRLAGGGVASGQFFGTEGTTLAFGGDYTLTQPSIVNVTNVDFDGGGTIDIYGAYTVTGSTRLSGIASPVINFKPDARITNLGDSLSIGGNCTLDLNSTNPITLNELILVHGMLTGASDITVNRKLTWDGGTISGSGKLTANGELEIKGTGKELAGRSLENSSKNASWSEGVINAYDGATLHNLTNGILNIVDTTGFVWCKPYYWSYGCSVPGEQPIFMNDGLVIKSGNKTMPFTSREGSSAVFNNSGTVDVQGGTIDFAGGYHQSAGMLQLTGGSISATDAVIDIQGGIVSGSGIITGDVVNAGQISTGDSVGTLSITGNYEQTVNGSLHIKIGGLNPGSDFDQIHILGTATLTGKVNITLVNGFIPALGNRFQIITYGMGNGQFTSFNGLDMHNGRRFRATYSSVPTVSDGLILEVVSMP